jgi:D-beta-D-heptose 7-phosphate kinase/D-beta-D-heptose 1-phosphate adenosyltransferase
MIDLDDIKEIKVSVIGDIMLDKYISGIVNRVSPEAPIPVVITKKENETLGGSGNVVANLRGLKAKVLPVGLIGKDIQGSLISALVSEIGCDIDYLFPYDQPTTQKIRVLGNNQQIVRIDYDPLLDHGVNHEKLLKHVKYSLKGANAAVLSDYGKGVCVKELVQETIRCGQEFNIPVFVDPKGKNFSKYCGATCITPNMNEANKILPFPLKSEDSFAEAGIYIREEYNIDICIITRGKNGMVISKGEETHFLSATALGVYDVSGAGDTVIATMAACVGAGIDYLSAAKVANVAAGIVVAHPGTFAINLKLLTNQLNELEISS